MARTAKRPRTVRPQHIAGCSVRFRPMAGRPWPMIASAACPRAEIGPQSDPGAALVRRRFAPPGEALLGG
jgi:hypothetical protein